MARSLSRHLDRPQIFQGRSSNPLGTSRISTVRRSCGSHPPRPPGAAQATSPFAGSPAARLFSKWCCELSNPSRSSPHAPLARAAASSAPSSSESMSDPRARRRAGPEAGGMRKRHRSFSRPHSRTAARSASARTAPKPHGEASTVTTSADHRADRSDQKSGRSQRSSSFLTLHHKAAGGHFSNLLANR